MSALPTSKTPAALRAAGKLPDKGKGRRDAKWHHEQHRQTGKGSGDGAGWVPAPRLLLPGRGIPTHAAPPPRVRP